MEPGPLELLKNSVPLSASDGPSIAACIERETTISAVSHANTCWIELGKAKSKQISLQTIPIENYEKTEVIAYRNVLGQMPDIGGVAGKRTVYLPACEFSDEKWHDGPLAVVEADGLISSYLPSGLSGTLLLAPDGEKATGRAKQKVEHLEGSRGEQLLRGATAACSRKIALIADKEHAVQVAETELQTATLPQTMAQLTVLRLALGKDRLLALVPATRGESTLVDPRLRRLVQHLGATIAPWAEPLSSLEKVFSWFDNAWTEDITAAINKHGRIIP